MKVNKPTKLIKLGAEWCQSCKTLDKVLSTLELDVAVESKDIDTIPPSELKALGVKGVPVMYLVDSENNIIEQKIGNIPKSNLVKWLTDNDVEVKQA